MSDELTDLQQLWQGQQAATPDFDELMQQCKRVSKGNKRDRLIVFITFPLTLIILLTQVVFIPGLPMMKIGISVVILAMSIFFILLLRNKIHPIKTHQNLDNQEFLSAYIKQLKQRKLLTSRYLWLYIILLNIGLNIGYIDTLKVLPLTTQLLIQVGLTAVLLLGSWNGIRKRMQTYKEEIDPLIEQLESMKK